MEIKLPSFHLLEGGGVGREEKFWKLEEEERWTQSVNAKSPTTTTFGSSSPLEIGGDISTLPEIPPNTFLVCPFFGVS